MEYEIHDDPQGDDCIAEGYRDGGLVEDHSALRNQSSVSPTDYPVEQRRAQDLTDTQASNT